jgi:Putative MetA-pathway of phenol degradation
VRAPGPSPGGAPLRRATAVCYLNLACLVCLWASPPAARAQQPFYTDDADVTPKGKLHFEFSNEFDWLQRSSFPNLRQNTASFELNYGLLERVEFGVEAPLLAIFNARGTSPRVAFGIGDTSLAAKYNFREERDGSRLPAMSLDLRLELPTGDSSTQLGSGLVDGSLNYIAQKSITERTKLRTNVGIIFAGNESTGAIGIQTRGLVLTGGASLVRTFTPRLQLGAEVTAASSVGDDIGQGLVRVLVGGNYELRKGLTLDFGLLVGWRDAAPRVGAQIGISVDF